jgi:hypothetical protein
MMESGLCGLLGTSASQSRIKLSQIADRALKAGKWDWEPKGVLDMSQSSSADY